MPPDTGFATKPRLATGMIERAITASVPFKLVADGTKGPWLHDWCNLELADLEAEPSNDVGSWHGWHRPVSMVMLAFAMMAVIRHHANLALRKDATPNQDKTKSMATAALIRWSIQDVLRIAIGLARIRPAHIIVWSLWRRLTRRSLNARISKPNGICIARAGNIANRMTVWRKRGADARAIGIGCGYRRHWRIEVRRSRPPWRISARSR